MMDENPIEKRIRLQTVLVAWETFIKSPAYPYFVSAQEEEAAGTRQAIVLLDPVDRASELESMKLRGDLRTEEQFITYFEDTATRLRDYVDQLIEAEQPSSKKQETE